MARILLSGSTGFIGRRLVADLRSAEDEVIPLIRGHAQPDAITWDPIRPLDPTLVSGFDAVIHLAGEPVVSLRWTARKKRRILNSRADGTRTLATALARAPCPPKTFLCASGINVYGNCGDAIVDETTPPGTGFLPEVCKAWEAACQPLDCISRIVNLRIGVVLSPEGGTLATILPLFRRGLGGTVAGGRTYLSWITLDDLSRAVGHILRSERLQGPVNLVSPNPVTSQAFAKHLAQAVQKPAPLSLPPWLIRLLLGELADETILSSVRSVPRRLLEDGFAFTQPTLSQALAFVAAQS